MNEDISSGHKIKGKLILNVVFSRWWDISQWILRLYIWALVVHEQSLALRHVESLVSALKAAAANAVGVCYDIRRLREGLFTLAFLLTMNNETEIVARIPTSASGAAHYTTASEVATIDFMCSLWGASAKDSRVVGLSRVLVGWNGIYSYGKRHLVYASTRCKNKCRLGREANFGKFGWSRGRNALVWILLLCLSLLHRGVEQQYS